MAQSESAFARTPTTTAVWRAVCSCVGVVHAQLAASSRVRALAVDAACSLAALHSDGSEARTKLLPWWSHVAASDAEQLALATDAGTPLRLHLGGAALHPELNLCKLHYLKRAERAVFDAAAHFFDLAGT